MSFLTNFRRKQMWLMAVSVIGLSAFWIYLSRSWLLVGPSQWDDVLYTEAANAGYSRWEIRNRFMHVWGLKVFTLLSSWNFIAFSLYPTVITLIIALLCFFWAKRTMGLAAGVLAFALTPLCFAFLKWITIPYVDTTLALYSMACLLSLLIALSDKASTYQHIAFTATGCFLYLACKSKETGLALVPMVLVYVIDRKKLVASASFGFGILLGWLVLFGLDTVFADPKIPWRSSEWSIYFASNPQTAPSSSSGIERMYEHYLHHWVKVEYLPFMLCALGAIASGFKKHLHVRILAFWFASSLIFGSLIAWRYRGIFADERYITSFAPAFVLLAVYFVADRWNAKSDPWSHAWPWWLALCVGSIPLAAHFCELLNQPFRLSYRVLFFLPPVSFLFLFWSIQLAPSRVIVRTSLVLMLTLTTVTNLRSAKAFASEVNFRMAPWHLLVTELDKQDAQVVRMVPRPHPYPVYRIRRRLRSLTRRSGSSISVHEISKQTEAGPREWIFVAQMRHKNLEKSGWKRFVQGQGNAPPWSVYRR